MRDFYTCALNAGATPTGQPAYRGQHDEVFNAAVVDLEGNTVEAVWRRGPTVDARTSPREPKSVVSRSDSSANTGPQVKAPTAAASSIPRHSPRSPPVSPTSTHLAAQAAKNPAPPDQDERPSKAFLGTLLGAAAGAAAFYSMFNAERDGSRKERAFADQMRKGGSSRERRSSSKRPAALAIPATSRDNQTSAVSNTGARKIPVRSSTHDGAVDKLPFSSSLDRTHSPRRDSGISMVSQKSSRSQRPPLRDDRHSAGFRDTFNASRAIDWVVDAVADQSGRRSSAPVPGSGRSRNEADRRPMGDPSDRQHRGGRGSSRFSAANVPLPRSVADSRASIRHQDLYARGYPKQESRRNSFAGPVSFDTIKRSFGSEHKRDGRSRRDRDDRTVLPEDSISCAESRASRDRDYSRHRHRSKPDRRMSLQDYPARSRDAGRSRRAAATAPLGSRTDDDRY